MGHKLARSGTDTGQGTLTSVGGAVHILRDKLDFSSPLVFESYL